MKKRWLAAAFAAVAAGCLLTGSLVSAGAETPAEQPGTFAFVNGASVRYSDPTGLRFTVQMDAATYTGLVEAGAYKDGRSMSVYIAPADYFEGAAGDYAAVAERAVEAEIGADKIYQNAEEYGSEIYLANAVLTNVLYENVNREFQAIAAIESADADPVWSEPSDVRSVAYVASAALTEEETDETQSAVLNGFVQKAIAEANDVAEEEFKEDGSYAVQLSLKETTSLFAGKEETLALSVTPAADLYVKWTSDNEDVATVDENGKVTAVSEGVANITTEVYGKTATCAVTVNPPAVRQYDFSEVETGATEVPGVSVLQGTNPLPYSVVGDDGEKALKVEYSVSAAADINIIFQTATTVDLTKYDYIDIELKKISHSGAGGYSSLGPGYNYPDGYGDTFFTAMRNGEWTTLTWNLDCVMSNGNTIRADMISVGRLLLDLHSYSAQDAEFLIKSITGRMRTEEEPAYGTIFDADRYYDGYRFGAVSNATATIVYDEVTGKNVLRAVDVGTNQNNTIITFGGEGISTIANFDYYTIKGRLSYDGAVANAYFVSVSGATVPAKILPAENGGNGYAFELKVDKDEHAWTYTNGTKTLQFTIRNWNDVPLITVITEITGGFDDITSDGATAIDLAEKFGSGLTQAVYTPADGEAQTLTGDSLKTFIGEESGTLKLTFEVDGYRATEFTVNYTVA